MLTAISFPLLIIVAIVILALSYDRAQHRQWVFTMLAVAAAGGAMRADESEDHARARAKAAALLAFDSIPRIRLPNVSTTYTLEHCDGKICRAATIYRDYAAAEKVAAADKRQLLIWVGAPRPELAVRFGALVQVHVEEWNGNKVARVLLPRGGDLYYFDRDKATEAGVLNLIRQPPAKTGNGTGITGSTTFVTRGS